VIGDTARQADIGGAMRRRVIRLLREERGVTLVLAITTMLVLSLTTASILTATAVNHRTSLRSSEADQAFALAQQGLAYAEGRLYSSPTNAESVLVPGTTITPADNTGTIAYRGRLCDSSSTPPCSPKVWTLYGTGTVDGISRTVSAQVTIPLTTQTMQSLTTYTSTDPTIWNYIYVDGTGTCTPISGNVTINVPIYTHGGLCLNGNVKYTGSDLEVGGQLSVTGAAKIGTSAAPISKLNVVGACSPSPCDGSHSPIWVTAPGVGHTLSPVLTKPPVYMQATYDTEMASSQSGCPAHFFDNDSTRNDSLGTLTAANLFPSGTSYDCHVGASELKWNGSHNLTINGTFYFDGNFSLSGNTKVVYTGKGSIYFTGSWAQGGTTQICGIASCAGTWDPNTNAIIFVAGCQNASGGTITTGCVAVSGTAALQAGLYSVTDYTVSGTPLDMGPVITSSASFLGTVSQMLPLHNLPPGAPANTTTVTVTTQTTTTVDGTPASPNNWNG
jgi:Tfp pilus assembly protein PilX